MNIGREAREIDPDTPLFGTGLRLDSLDAVDLWVHVGVTFGLKPPEDPVVRLGATRTLNTLQLVLARATESADPSDSVVDSEEQTGSAPAVARGA